MKQQTIQSTLLNWLIYPFIVFIFLLFTFVYLLLYEKINDFFDDRLYASAQSIEDSLGIENGKLIIDFPNFSIDLLSGETTDLIYYSVKNEEDEVLIGYHHLFDKSKLKNKRKAFYTLKFDNEILRAISYKTVFKDSKKDYIAYITIAETTNERDKNLHELVFILLLILLFVFISTIIISLYAVKKGLKPLHKLERIIEKRDRRDLSPVVFNAPKEIEDVVESINILLQRSKTNIEYVEHFNSDVSHQLRTPLAELRVKVEQYYKKDEQEYKELSNLIDNMAHITEQLLLYAKTNPNNTNLERFDSLIINDFLKDYSLKTVPRIYKKGFEFEFCNYDENIEIKADKILLESMLDNIINNALAYAKDENNNPLGTITLGLKKEHQKLHIYIKDEGKGILDKDLKKIFDRSFRADTKTKGNGLGLNIVKQIAQLHHAKVEAKNDKGLVLSIVFDI